MELPSPPPTLYEPENISRWGTPYTRSLAALDAARRKALRAATVLHAPRPSDKRLLRNVGHLTRTTGREPLWEKEKQKTKKRDKKNVCALLARRLAPWRERVEEKRRLRENPPVRRPHAFSGFYTGGVFFVEREGGGFKTGSVSHQENRPTSASARGKPPRSPCPASARPSHASTPARHRGEIACDEPGLRLPGAVDRRSPGGFRGPTLGAHGGLFSCERNGIFHTTGRLHTPASKGHCAIDRCSKILSWCRLPGDK